MIPTMIESVRKTPLPVLSNGQCEHNLSRARKTLGREKFFFTGGLTQIPRVTHSAVAYRLEDGMCAASCYTGRSRRKCHSFFSEYEML